MLYCCYFPRKTAQMELLSTCVSFMNNNISSAVEFLKLWVLKSKIFGQESTYSKKNVLKKLVDELQFFKKCQNRTFKVNFGCQKLIEFFQKKIYLRISI